jgi:predicted Abi (CAAX) family protease
MLPRAAHDQLATLFLNQGGQLWLLETNQIGGWNPDILPVAPTVLFGQITIPFTNIAPIPLGLSRVLTSLTIPKIQDGLIVVGMLLIYSGISLPLGLATGFLHLTVNTLGWRQQLSIALQAVIFPALSEELCFRVLFLPHPSEAVPWQQWILPAIFMLFLFILYHPLNAKTLFKAGFPTFFQPIFLILAGLLGLVCTVTYQLTGSLWAIAFIHWIVVVVWLLKLGGIEKLPSRNESQIRNSL